MSSTSPTPCRWPVLPGPVLLATTVASLWLMLPILTSVHLEGFTAQVQSIAWLMANAPGIPHDPHMPQVTQYIYQVKAGVIDLLHLIFLLAPQAGDWAFRGLMLGGFALLVATSLKVAAHWGQTPPQWGWLALVLVPGIPELSFFFNDNLISAALAASSLACLAAARHTVMRCVAAGVLMALATLCRIDAVLLMPILVGAILCAPTAQPGWRRWTPALWLGLSAGLTLLLLSALHGFSVIDVFVIGKQFSVDIDAARAQLLMVRLRFIGLAAAPFWLIGLGCTWLACPEGNSRWHKILWRLTFIVYPVLLFFLAPRVTQMRYVLPLLTPLLAWHVAAGLAWTWRAWQQGRLHRGLAMVLLAWCVITMAWPPHKLILQDGPRTLVGRLWTPAAWLQWQAAAELSMQRLHAFTNELDHAEQSMVISSHFSEEFYLRLRLIEAGYQPVATSRIFPGCAGFAVLQKAHHTVLHLRTEPQYGLAPIRQDDNAAMQAVRALDCPGLKHNTAIHLTTYGQRYLDPVLSALGVARARFTQPLTDTFALWPTPWAPIQPPAKSPELEFFDHIQLSSVDLQRMQTASREHLSQHPVLNLITGQPYTLEDYQRAYQAKPGPTQHLWDRLGWVMWPQP